MNLTSTSVSEIRGSRAFAAVYHLEVNQLLEARLTVDITGRSEALRISVSSKVMPTGRRKNATDTELAERLTIAVDSLRALAKKLSKLSKQIKPPGTTP